jgi:hypothetical protein
MLALDTLGGGSLAGLTAINESIGSSAFCQGDAIGYSA